jgi:hypothetical protein
MRSQISTKREEDIERRVARFRHSDAKAEGLTTRLTKVLYL